ncbi:P-loop NTPase fold protein [Planctellipticum variicoloris]|uniref:P-loop NTPase fold protein n=1 Tax=Planctellipticum variicoloris TaxID=3064265 RepID=UPI003013B921|nr:KAP family NTPase [Planctomycetaceae bacterium SH412]
MSEADVLRRWICMLITGVGAGIIAHAAWRLHPSLPFGPALQFIEKLQPHCQYAIALAMSLLISFISLQNAPIGGIEWLRNNLRYPSVWVALLVAFGTFVLLEPDSKASDRIADLLWTDLALVVGMFAMSIAVVLMVRTFRAQSLPSRTSRQPSGHPSLNETWWDSDAPVERDADDRFGFKPIVDRVAAHLSSDSDFTLFLDGPYGSGKSSILAMARSRTVGEDNLVICRLSCWDFPTSEDVIHFILERAVEELGTRVDVTAFKRLPAKYGRAIFRDSGWLSQLFEFVQLLVPQFGQSPDRMISDLNRLIRQLNLRLVVEIEDLDRTGLDDRSLQPVWALIHHLRDADHISVIVAGSPENDFVRDAQKLFDFVETVPTLTASALQDDIALFEKKVFEQTGVIDCRDGERLPTLRVPNEVELAAHRAFRMTLDDTLDALQELVRTPRAWNLLLRETNADWDRLAGEIDFDDLVIANALRLFARPAFWYVDQFRAKEPRGRHTSHDSRAWSEMIRKAWRRVAIDEASKPAAWSLVRTLMGIGIYPEMDEKGEKVRSRPEYYCEGDAVVAIRPQSVLSHDFGDEYWRRIRNRDLGPNPVRDQELLRLNKDSQIDPNLRRELAAALVGDEGTASRWKRLTDGWPVTAALELADDVINELKSSSAESRRFEALAIVRRRLRSLTEGDESKIYEWIMRTSIENARCDWAVMTCLLDRWAKGDIGQDQLVSAKAREDLLKHVQATVADALRSERLRPIDYLRPTEEWSALAGVVSIAGTSIAHITGLASSGHEWIRELAEAIFEEAQQAPTKWTGHLIVLFWGVNGIQAAKDGAVPAFGVDLCRRAFSWISEQPIEHKGFCTGMGDRDWIRGEEVLQQARAWLEKDAESDQ